MAYPVSLVVLAAVAVQGTEHNKSSLFVKHTAPGKSTSSFVTHPIAVGGKSALDLSVLTVAATSSVVNNSHAHLNGHLVKVSNPKGRFSVVEPLPGGCGTVALVKETAALYKPQCKLGVNAGYYDITQPPHFNCFGNVVSDNRIVQTGNWTKRNVNFGIKDGQWIIGYITPEDVRAGGFEQLVQGMGWIVHEGKNYVTEGWKEAYTKAGAGGEGYAATTSGRTGIGYDKDGQLIVLQFDGHTGAPSWGATLTELADMMIEQGAVEAINLDGGGSTQMVQDGVQIGYSSDRTVWGTLKGTYDPNCPMGHGPGNLSRFECTRMVSTILCIHESTEDPQADSARMLGLGADLECRLPQALVTAIVLVGIAVMVLHLRGSDLQERLKYLLRINLFTAALLFTMPILDSRRIAEASQATQTFSGFYIGCFYIGATIAGVCMWRLLQKFPQSWRKWVESVYLPSALGILISGLLLTCAEHRLASKSVATGSTEATLAQMALCMVQLISGACAGMAAQSSLVLLVKLVHVDARPTAMAGAGMAGMVGAGAGPFVAAIMDSLNLCSRFTDVNNVGAVGPAKVMVGVMLLALLMFAAPDLVGAIDHSVKPRVVEQNGDDSDLEKTLTSDASSDDSSTQSTYASKRKLVIGAFMCTALRGYILSSLEAGTSLLLEVNYGWDMRRTGLAVAATLFACVPVNALYKKMGKSMPAIQWVNYLACAGLVGSIALFKGSSAALDILFGEGAAGSMLLIADVIVFPFIYQADVIQRGIMTQNLLPEGSCLDSNHAGAWQMLAWVANSIAPVGSRFFIAQYGQNVYAIQQALLIVLFLEVSRHTVKQALMELDE